MSSADDSSANDPIPSDLVRDDDSFTDLVQAFVEGLAERLGAMEEALVRGDLDALRCTAHQLKGAGGGYGYPLLTERAAALEQAARQNVLDDCREHLQHLQQLVARVVVRID